MKDQEIIDFGWDNILKEYMGMEESHVDVGIVARDGSKKDGTGDLSLVELASIHEFGTTISHPGGKGPNAKGPYEIVIPSRPFVRQTFDKNFKGLQKLVDQKEEEIQRGKTSRRDALTLIGQTHQNQIQKAMATKGEFEANAPSTIRRKGSDTPLIDSGRLRQSINFEVG